MIEYYMNSKVIKGHIYVKYYFKGLSDLCSYGQLVSFFHPKQSLSRFEKGISV